MTRYWDDDYYKPYLEEQRQLRRAEQNKANPGIWKIFNVNGIDMDIYARDGLEADHILQVLGKMEHLQGMMLSIIY